MFGKHMGTYGTVKENFIGGTSISNHINSSNFKFIP